jgi:hypothetical protein
LGWHALRKLGRHHHAVLEDFSGRRALCGPAGSCFNFAENFFGRSELGSPRSVHNADNSRGLSLRDC